jgi:hypothetical protein
MVNFRLREHRDQDCRAEKTIELVRRRAELIALQVRPWMVEVSDIEHDLWVSLLESEPVLRQTLAPAIAKHALRRAARSIVCRLRTQAKSECDAERGTLSRSMLAVRSDYETIDFAHDVAAVVSKLPWRMNQLARFLMDESGPEIAARWAVSRASVHAMIRRIRKRFVAAGLSSKFG